MLPGRRLCVRVPPSHASGIHALLQDCRPSLALPHSTSVPVGYADTLSGAAAAFSRICDTIDSCVSLDPESVGWAVQNQLEAEDWGACRHDFLLGMIWQSQ